MHRPLCVRTSRLRHCIYLAKSTFWQTQSCLTPRSQALQVCTAAASAEKQARRKGKASHGTQERSRGQAAQTSESSVEPRKVEQPREPEGPVQLSASLKARLRREQQTPPPVITAFDEPEDAHGEAAEALSGAQGPASLQDNSATLSEPQLPPPKNSRVTSAEYVSSSVSLRDCPPPKYPEIAVIGRSNVGKSSLINMLTGRRELALVSKTPGKTQCINHFLINRYAKSAMTRRMEWGKFTQDFLKRRQTLANVLLLVDASVPVQNVDLGCAEWLWERQIPFSLVYTKTDKHKKRCPPPEENVAVFEVRLAPKLRARRLSIRLLSESIEGSVEQEELRGIIGTLPAALSTSSVGNVGKGSLLSYLSQLRQLHAVTV